MFADFLRLALLHRPLITEECPHLRLRARCRQYVIVRCARELTIGHLFGGLAEH